MYRISWVDFVLVANALMGLGAFIAVIFGDINLDQILIGAGFGFLSSFPVFLLVFVYEKSDEPKRHVRCWYELGDHTADCATCTGQIAA